MESYEAGDASHYIFTEVTPRQNDLICSWTKSWLELGSLFVKLFDTSKIYSTDNVDDVLGMLLNKLFDTSQSIGLRLIWAAGISQLSRWSRQTIVAYIDYLSGVDIVCVRTHCIIAQTLARMVIEYEGRGHACYAITSLVRHRSKYAQSNAS